MSYNDTTPHHFIRWSKQCLSSHYNAITIFCRECNGNNSNPWRPNLATQSTNWIYRQHPEARHKRTSPDILCPSLHGPESGPILSGAFNDIVPAHSMDAQSYQHHLKNWAHLELFVPIIWPFISSFLQCAIREYLCHEGVYLVYKCVWVGGACQVVSHECHGSSFSTEHSIVMRWSMLFTSPVDLIGVCDKEPY